jgi:hypothetical protein
MLNTKLALGSLLTGTLIGMSLGSELFAIYPPQSLPSTSLVGVDKCDQALIRSDCYNIPSEFYWMYLFAGPEKPTGRGAKHHKRH